MSGWINDLRYALRSLARHPRLVVVVLLSLSFGIGTNAVVLTWIQNILRRPLSGVANQDRLVTFTPVFRSQVFGVVAYPDLRDYASLSDVFEGVVGAGMAPAAVTVGDQADWLYGQVTTANFFQVLGVTPVLGRAFRPEEDGPPGAHPVIVIGHGYWQRRFAGSPSVIGRQVTVNGRAFTVVGVAPAAFHGTFTGLKLDFWVPMAMFRHVANSDSHERRGDQVMIGLARLRDGVGLDRAQAAVAVFAQRLARTYPDTNVGRDMRLAALGASPLGAQAVFRPIVPVLVAVGLLVLLVVAANVSSLLLVRAVGRQREMAIRMALGSGRWRPIRQVLVECIAVGILGGCGGLLLAVWMADLLNLGIPGSPFPIGFDFRIDLPVVLATLGLSVAAAVLIGLAPAFEAVSAGVGRALEVDGRQVTGSRRRHRLRSVLVVGEIAVALLLLVAAGLCLSGIDRARRVDPGFEAQGAWVASIRPGAHGYTTDTAKQFYRRLRARVAEVPGVQEVGFAGTVPLGFQPGYSLGLEVEGYTPQAGESMETLYTVVSPGYFAAMQIPIVNGRDFTDRDDDTAEQAAIVNEAVARRYWPGQNPIGRHLRVFGERRVTVVGVVKNGKYAALNEPQRTFLYLPYQQGGRNLDDLNLTAVVRARRHDAMTGALRAAVREIDPAVRLWNQSALADYVEAAFLLQRVLTVVLMVLGALALALATLGVYAVMAHTVAQRTSEIGIRLALGARPADVVRLVVRHGMRLAAAGILCGMGAAAASTRLLSALLYGVSPLDPTTFLIVAVLMGVVMFTASYLPARRASRIQPLAALRVE